MINVQLFVDHGLEAAQFTLGFLLVARSLPACLATHRLFVFLPYAGITHATPIDLVVLFVGIGTGIGLALLAQRSFHLCYLTCPI